jgi:hypothetical protein
MSTLSEAPEIVDVADAARKLADRIDRTLIQDPSRAAEAADVVFRLRSRVTEAAMAAFPRAETRRQRESLLHVLDSAAYPWDFEALSFLERIARDEPDEAVRLYAESLRQYLSRDEDPDEDW